MTRPALTSALAVLSVLAAAPAMAQVPPPFPGQPAFDQNRYQADQSRYEMERLRARADQREAFARQLDTETRMRRLQVESARQPALALPEAGQTREAREAATRRRQAAAEGVAQIDAWLDRPAD